MPTQIPTSPKIPLIGQPCILLSSQRISASLNCCSPKELTQSSCRYKNGLTAVEICEDEDVCDELRRHTISQSQTNTQPIEKEHEEQQNSRETTEALTEDNKQDSETMEETNVDDRASSDKGKVAED